MAEISHGVTILASETKGSVSIYLARHSASIAPLVECYFKAYDLFGQFMKDYVRVNIYPRIQQYVPTSTKGGVDALRDVLMRSRELFRYEESERGDLEGLLGDYLSGAVSFSKVLSSARTTVRAHTQSVSAEQVGTIEREFPQLVQSPVEPPAEAQQDLTAQPPIIFNEIASSMKILTTNTKYALLNSFTMFLGVSDRLMNAEGDFLRRPHTTRVIWAGHRVVYIFTEDTGRLSLYYDIELKSPLNESKTGGGLFRTTTLVTKTRIFVPIPEALTDEFEIGAGPREFFVRFDILSSDSPTAH
jgi:molecular chaperone HtpG